VSEVLNRRVHIGGMGNRAKAPRHLRIAASGMRDGMEWKKHQRENNRRSYDQARNLGKRCLFHNDAQLRDPSYWIEGKKTMLPAA